MTGESSDATSLLVDDPETVLSDGESVDHEEATSTSSKSTPDETRHGRSRRRPRLWTVACSVLLVAILAAAVWALVAGHEQSDQRAQIDEQVAVKSAATTGAARILSYKPQTVDQDIASARSLLTGTFLDYFTKFTTDVVIPSSKEKQIATTATVPVAGVSSINGDDAVVIVMVDQETTSAENPQPSQSASTVRVEMTKVGDKWLITRFDPV